MAKDVVAKLRFLRIAPRKVRLVLDLIRGRNVLLAEEQLMHLPKISSAPILKLLKSAEANAQHNFKLDPKTLFVKQAFADEGPKLKRFQPHAMGRATEIFKRMSHVTIILGEKSQAGKGKPAAGQPSEKLKTPPVKSAAKPGKPASTATKKISSTKKK